MKFISTDIFTVFYFTKYDTKEIISMEERTKGARNEGKIEEGMQNKSKDKKL